MSEKEEEKVDIETPSATDDKAEDDKKEVPADEPHHIIIAARLSAEQKAYFGLMMSAIIQIIAITVPDQKNNYVYGYGIALGSLSLIFAAIGLAFGFVKSMDAKAKVINSYFLFFWTFIGACFMTFGEKAPFKDTGNGYFASWGMALFAVMAVGVSFDEVRHTATGMGPRLGLFVSSLIVLVASASFLGEEKKSDDETAFNVSIFAVTLSGITVITISFLIFCGVRRNDDESPNPFVFFIILVFCICWIVEAFFSTFYGPFDTTGNGYFASWGAAFSSLFALIPAAKRLMTKKEPGHNE